MWNDLRNAIDREMIFLQQDLDTREAVLSVMVEGALRKGLIGGRAPFVQAVLERESMASTAIGYCIAIPHGKSEFVRQPFIGFLQTEQEFRWTEEQEETVKLVFLIGVPKENEHNIHLKFISKLSKKLLDDEFRAVLLTCTDTDQAYDLLNSLYTLTD